jgi:UDP-glucuronate 4-epimerase
MKIVVTGGAGFIGSHLIDKLLDDNHNVVNIDNFDSFYDYSIKERNIKGHYRYDNYELKKIDIRDYSKLANAIPNDTEVIVHLAAKAGVRPSIIDPVSYQEVNVTGTQNLLEIAKEKNIGKFIFASSSSVYGKNPKVPWSESDAVLQPISPYASTKVSGELLGHVYSHLYDINFIALRFFTVYGPRQRPDLAIHKFTKLKYDNEPITLFGKGETKRDYTYIDDIILGINSCLNYEDSSYEIINLGNNNTVELRELVENMEAIIGSKFIKRVEPEQPGDVTQTWADVDKANRLLGYNPSTNITEGLKKFIQWFKDTNTIKANDL